MFNTLLVTHGVIVGMTGSGKTGLGIDLLEEALLSGIPCLILDPKGDMGNLRLIFPDFAPTDFAPWIDPAEAERQGKSLEELTTDTARMWKEGLEAWDVRPERMRSVRGGAAVTIYTPSSTAGVPLDIRVRWRHHPSHGTTTPRTCAMRSRVSCPLCWSWPASRPTPSRVPPTSSSPHHRGGVEGGPGPRSGPTGGHDPRTSLPQAGVFELEAFYPRKDRNELAMQLNGLLASPSFAAWLGGEPLDIENLLTGGDRTKAAVVYLAHLSDSERQFVVTSLLAKLVTWMRRQSGTGKLRVLVYMDEVFGFAPPVAEPPAKKQILTILKQARAFGVGMVLATQNPVDLDYKAMSNAGTSLVGRLQTENDKKRILEGLADAGGMTDTGAVDVMISNLDKRQFVLRQTGEAEPQVFGTRWAMSYLAGPLDRTRVGLLTQSEVFVPLCQSWGGGWPDPRG